MFLENSFYLMNKDIKILRFEIIRDEFGVDFKETSSYKKENLPLGYEDINQWLTTRQAPKHRAHIENLLRECGCYNLEGFIRFTHALSLNDTFWVKPETSLLQWKEVSLYNNHFDETISRIAFEGGLYGKEFSPTSPEFGTDGSFAKCWVKSDDSIYLMKRGSTGARNSGLEPYSEYYASQLAKYICKDYVTYDVVNYRGNLASKCKLFTSEEIGFAPIYKCVSNKKPWKEVYGYYSRIGSEEAFRRMLVFDALIINTDRHRGNFGVLFNTDTMQVLEMAPLFDNNLSLLPYADKEDFLDMKKYLASRPTEIGEDFNAIAHRMLTPSIKSDLVNLRGFTFNRNGNLDMPEERLEILEQMINTQIENILKDIRLYVPSIK